MEYGLPIWTNTEAIQPLTHHCAKSQATSLVNNQQTSTRIRARLSLTSYLRLSGGLRRLVLIWELIRRFGWESSVEQRTSLVLERGLKQFHVES